jgi:hypothetical protein
MEKRCVALVYLKAFCFLRPRASPEYTMRQTPTRFQITPGIIDLGHRIIQLSQVATASVGVVHPLRPLARLPFIAGCLLGLLALMPDATGPAESNAGAISGIAILALISLAVSAVLHLYAVRRLVIATSDGLPTWLKSSDLTFLHLVLDKIRAAMTATDPDWHVAVDLLAKTIESQGVPAGGSNPAAASFRVELDQPEAGWFDRGAMPDHFPVANGTAHANAPGLAPVNGKLAAEPRSSFAEAMLGEDCAAVSATAKSDPTRSPAPSNGRAELADVMALIDHAQLPHKAELHALLSPVMDHVTGGRTSRSDAKNNWQLFHDYASKYLTDVDDLDESCRRVQASLT